MFAFVEMIKNFWRLEFVCGSSNYDLGNVFCVIVSIYDGLLTSSEPVIVS